MYQFTHAPEIKSLEHEIRILEYHLEILKQSKEIIIDEISDPSLKEVRIIYSKCNQLQSEYNPKPNNPHFFFQIINSNIQLTKEQRELIHEWLQNNV